MFIKREFKFDETLRVEVKQMIVEAFKKDEQTNIRILKQIEDIFQLKFHRLISVYELNSTKNAEEAVLKAFMQANDCHAMAKLCLSWNRVDVAKEYIFNDNFTGNVKHI